MQMKAMLHLPAALWCELRLGQAVYGQTFEPQTRQTSDLNKMYMIYFSDGFFCT